MEQSFIPLSVPNLKGNELKYVTEAIQSEWVSTGGKFIIDFEQKISEYVGTCGATACQSGTAGLHLSLKVCGIGQGDEVIVPTLTFIAAVNPVKYVGANPVFMDCDNTLNIDCDKVERFLSTQCEIVEGVTVNKKTKAIVKGIIVVHVFGNIANMKRIIEIAKKFNLKVIEDATEALGSYYESGAFKGCFAGTIGDIGVYSFNGNKIITCGGGGMVVSHNKEYLRHAKYLSTQAKDDDINFLHGAIGYNYRMTNLQAAVGLAQLECLEDFIEKKKKNYYQYKKRINQLSFLKMMEFEPEVRPNYWFYSVLFKNATSGIEKQIEYMMSNRIQTRPIWGLIHEQTPYKKSQSYMIEKASYYRKRILNIPCSSSLEEKDIVRVLNALEEIVEKTNAICV